MESFPLQSKFADEFPAEKDCGNPATINKIMVSEKIPILNFCFIFNSSKQYSLVSTLLLLNLLYNFYNITVYIIRHNLQKKRDTWSLLFSLNF